MPQYLFANNATTTVAAPITAASTQVTLTAGTGSLFPNPGPNQIFEGTFVKNGNTTIRETVVCASRSSDTCVIQRSAGALSWNAGDTFALLVNADAFNNAMVQPFQAQAQTYNYANDIGTVNAYRVALNPPLTASVTGMPIRWKAANTNTGDSTFSDGVSTGNLDVAIGEFVPAGGIVAGTIYESVWDGVGRFFTTGWNPYPILTGYTTNASFATSSGGFVIPGSPAVVVRYGTFPGGSNQQAVSFGHTYATIGSFQATITGGSNIGEVGAQATSGNGGIIYCTNAASIGTWMVIGT